MGGVPCCGRLKIPRGYSSAARENDGAVCNAYLAICPSALPSPIQSQAGPGKEHADERT